MTQFTSARDLVDNFRNADQQGRLDRAQRNDPVRPRECESC